MDPRVIVVGGGIVGAATAFRLAQAGAGVTLLDAGHPGHGASVVSFAWLNANDKPPLDYHLLNVAGMNEYPRLREEFGYAPWLHPSGNVEWDATDGGPTRLRAKVERLRGWGYAAELLPVRELRLLEPDLVAPPALAEFAYYPDEGYVDPVLLIASLIGAARDAGAEVRTQTAVARLLREGDRVVGVETAAGERLRADVVVSCVGSRSDELTRLVGIELPLAPTVGMIAISAPATVRLRAVHHDEAVQLRPDGAGRVVMRHEDFDARVEPGRPIAPALLDALRERAAAVLPGLAGIPIEATRIGVRPIPGDHYSAVGPLPGMTGLYAVVTHSAVTLGALLGRLVAAEIMTGEADPRLTRFRPERLTAPTLT